MAFTPPSAGSYRLVAESTDEQGRVARSARSLWVSGSGHARWFVRDDNRIELVADRESYEVGDVARVLVPAPFAGATGLVTVERGRVLDSEVRAFDTNSEVLLIPIEQGHLPNVYVGVVLYRPPTEEDPLPRYRIGYVNLPVATDPVALDVRVEPDREQAIPGETVRYDVHVTDSEGRGVAAEVSVAIVDEAVLSLAAEVGPDGLGAFWSERSLGVRTAWSRAPAERQGGGDSDMAVAEPAAAPAAARAESAAPGDDAARIRSDFRYTALWLGQLTTDADGRASFELEAPRQRDDVAGHGAGRHRRDAGRRGSERAPGHAAAAGATGPPSLPARRRSGLAAHARPERHAGGTGPGGHDRGGGRDPRRGRRAVGDGRAGRLRPLLLARPRPLRGHRHHPLPRDRHRRLRRRGRAEPSRPPRRDARDDGDRGRRRRFPRHRGALPAGLRHHRAGVARDLAPGIAGGRPRRGAARLQALHLGVEREDREPRRRHGRRLAREPEWPDGGAGEPAPGRHREPRRGAELRRRLGLVPRVLGDEHLGHRLGAARPRGGAGRRVRRLRSTSTRAPWTSSRST